MLNVSEKIVIDLTENIANVGETLSFAGEFKLSDDLIPYPNAMLVKVALDLNVVFDNPNVIVDGIITCFVKGYCDRCLKQLEVQIPLPFAQIFYKDQAEAEDQYVYTSSLLDITQAVSDEVVLSLPMTLLCKEECKGLCPRCGCNLNEQLCDCDTSRDNPFSILKNLKF